MNVREFSVVSGVVGRLGSVHFASGLLSLVLGLVILVQARGFSRMGSYMPNLVGWLLIGLGVLLCVVHLFALMRIDDPEKAEGGISRKLVFIGLMGGWVMAMPVLGFLTSAILGFLVVALLVPRKRWRPTALLLDTAMGTTVIVAIYLLSTHYLDLAFPRGLII